MRGEHPLWVLLSFCPDGSLDFCVTGIAHVEPQPYSLAGAVEPVRPVGVNVGFLDGQLVCGLCPSRVADGGLVVGCGLADDVGCGERIDAAFGLGEINHGALAPSDAAVFDALAGDLALGGDVLGGPPGCRASLIAVRNPTPHHAPPGPPQPGERTATTANPGGYRSRTQWLAPGNCLAILGSSTPWSGSEPWQAVAVDVVARWSGEPGRPASASAATAGSGGPARRTHEDILREAGFANVTEYQFPTPHAWTLDEFIGFLWSTSYTARIRQDPALATEFEKHLRAQLLECEPSGQLRESIAHYYILGRKPTLRADLGECSAAGSGRVVD